MDQLSREQWHQQEVKSSRLRPLQLLGVPSGLGAGDTRTGLAPASLVRAGLLQRLLRDGLPVEWRMLECGDGCHAPCPSDRFGRMCYVASATADAVEAAVTTGNRFVVLGGDHSIAAGTWSGAARALRHKGPLGLVWIDAHLDAHVPETSPSGNWHGMPIAHLLGYGSSALRALGGDHASIRPSDLCLVGARSFEKPETDLLTRLGVRVIAMEELRHRGVKAVLREAVQLVTARTVGFGISFDIDFIDPNQAPAVGTPVAGGLDSRLLLDALPKMAGHPSCFGLEVVEYNPLLDRRGRTGLLVSKIVTACSLRMTTAGSVWQDAGHTAYHRSP